MKDEPLDRIPADHGAKGITSDRGEQVRTGNCARRSLCDLEVKRHGEHKRKLGGHLGPRDDVAQQDVSVS